MNDAEGPALTDDELAADAFVPGNCPPLAPLAFRAGTGLLRLS